MVLRPSTIEHIAPPSWASDADVTLLYIEACQRLVFEFDESLATAQLLLEAWHRFEGKDLHHAHAAFRDFWPWYADTRS